MKKILFLLFGIFIIVTLFIIYNKFHKIPLVIINNRAFYMEIAKTQKEQEIGLAKYRSFANNRAMYFPFTHADYYIFWMKNMHFPIDILFLQNKRIVTIYASVPAPTDNELSLPTYRASSPADSVLEINAGLSQKYGFKIGDSVDFFQ